MALDIERQELINFSVTFFSKHLTLIIGKNIFTDKDWEARDMVKGPICALWSISVYLTVIHLSNILAILWFFNGLINFWNVSLFDYFIISGFRTFFPLVVRFLTFQIVIEF